MDKQTKEAVNHATKETPGGLQVGFATLDEYWQWKQGDPVIINGLPHSGKSEFLYEILLNLTESENKTHFIFSPEAGSKAKLTNLLAEKILKKPVNQLNRDGSTNLYAASVNEVREAIEWMSNYIRIVDKSDFYNPKQITLHDIYREADKGNFDTVSIDTFTHLYNERNLPLYEWVPDISKDMKADGEKNNRSTFLVLHCGKTQTSYNENGVPYVRPPHPNEAHGGPGWFREADNWLQIYINENLTAEKDYEYETWVIVQKVRERTCGKKGIVKLGWCPKTQGRYYEHINDFKRYGNEHTY